MRRRQIPGEPPPPSKGELRRRALALQELGDQLIDGPEFLLAGLSLPEKLHDAIAQARRIRSHAALLRQRRYVAKLLRDLDAGPVQAALGALDATTRQDAARFRHAERWRDRLIDDGDPAIDAFLATCPGADRAVLIELVVRAVAERTGAGPAGAARALFRRVRELLGATRPAAAAGPAPHARIDP